MKIAVIGAGFTGLATAFELAKKGHDISVFEKDLEPGGLAIGFKKKEWKWTLEKHYHHWFSNDSSIISLAQEIKHNIIIKRPKSSVYIAGKIFQLDSPLLVLKFPLLPFTEKLRMATVLGILKYNPFWKFLEKYKAHNSLIKTMGKKSYKLIWEPQLINKFGTFYKDISLAWFWARINKRTPSLVYPEGGFLSFARRLVKECEKKNVKFFFGTQVNEINSIKNKVKITYENEKPEYFDKVVVTLPSFYFTKIAKDLPKTYTDKLLSLRGLGAINLVLRLKKSFLADGTYWLSVCEKNAPVMAIVEHTNFMDKKFYNNEHLVYLGNYLPSDHKYFSMDKNQLLKIYSPFLKKMKKDFLENIIDSEVFKVPFAQPIIPVNYSKNVPDFKTPLKNVFLANIQQVYPWDRGTNYAVEIGKKVAKIVEKK